MSQEKSGEAAPMTCSMEGGKPTIGSDLSGDLSGPPLTAAGVAGENACFSENGFMWKYTGYYRDVVSTYRIIFKAQMLDL